MTSWIDGVDYACDCATAAPIVLDNLRRFEERRPLLNQSDPARGYWKAANAPRPGLTQNAVYGKSPRTRSSLLQCVRGAQPRRTAKQLEASMKFKTNYSIPQNTWLPMLKKWSSMSPQERANAGDGVKIIGRWHDFAARNGVVIFEASDFAAVQRYIGQWNPYMDTDLTPVLDDEESAALARQIVADNNA
jgi:Domain of unknown function (DUF3303)